jgi:hypothetical protein
MLNSAGKPGLLEPSRALSEWIKHRRWHPPDQATSYEHGRDAWFKSFIQHLPTSSPLSGCIRCSRWKSSVFEWSPALGNAYQHIVKESVVSRTVRTTQGNAHLSRC